MSPADARRPIVLAFAGPNGSGKSTVTRKLLPSGTYVNADDIKRDYELTDIEAAQMAESLRRKLLDDGADFTFETVLSTDRNLLLLQEAKSRGYEVQCIYVLTRDENINVARVRSRHIKGGHDVPEDKIRLRYHRALELLPRVVETCDKILVYDNSGDKPVLIFRKENSFREISPNIDWSEDAIKTLLGL